ncbi:hypothetical protein JG688_00002678, partial [Phytophthora aleatoria]
APIATAWDGRRINFYHTQSSCRHGSGAPGKWLRKPVFGIDEGTYVSGQVIDYDGDTVSIRTVMGERIAYINDLAEITPVLCYHNGQSSHRVVVMTTDELIEQHHLILDRLLGSGAQRPTCAISELLAGIIPTRLQPKPDNTLRWINVTTGLESTVSVRHAIDFAYYIDGNQRVTPSIRGGIGARFDDDPRYGNVPATGGNDGNVRDDMELEAILNAIGTEPTTDPVQSRPRGVEDAATDRRSDQESGANNHAKVLAAIADDPNLIHFYLSMCKSGAAKRSAPSLDTRESQRRRQESPSDLIDAMENRDRRSKRAFNPPKTQQRVNELITAPAYDPSAVVDCMVSSRSTKCQSHPAIITCAYDFEVGARGLLLMHFERFDFAARRACYADRSVNLNHLAASVGFPKATKPQTLDDVSNALAVLHVITEAFFDHHTRRVVGAAREFVEDFRSFCHWSAQDVGTLTFWFD